jgi:arylsulfatase A-like enzyme
VIRAFASLADIYPTVLELAGAPPVDGEQEHGRSLLPLLDGQPVSAWREAVVTEFHGLGGYGLAQRTIRCGDFKYGYNFGGLDELYDLARDPWETRNLIADGDYAEAARDLRQRLLDWMQETGDDDFDAFRRSRGFTQGKWRTAMKGGTHARG